MLLKALAKSNGKLFALRAITIAIAILGRAITLERKPSKKKQRTDTKKDAKRIKSDNFTRSNREKSNIVFKIIQVMGSECISICTFSIARSCHKIGIFRKEEEIERNTSERERERER